MATVVDSDYKKQEHDQSITDAAGKRGNLFDSILLRAIIFFRTKNTYGLGKAVKKNTEATLYLHNYFKIPYSHYLVVCISKKTLNHYPPKKFFLLNRAASQRKQVAIQESSC